MLKLTPVGAPDGSRCWEDYYEEIAQVGEGMYGQVYKMRDLETGEMVALKKVRMDNEKEGFPITAIREIKLLSGLSKKQETHVVTLKEIVNSKAAGSNDNKGDIFMVFEYMEHDLAGIRENKQFNMTIGGIKVVMRQILMSLMTCHSNQILHRDLKCSNVLVNNHGDVKLGDFGLARPTGDKKRLTPKVITLWYRPPELLLGFQEYDGSVDVWSAGCILAELICQTPLLPGRDEFDQMYKIMKLFGNPTEETWPGVTKLPLYSRLVENQKKYTNRFREEVIQRVSRKTSHSPPSESCLDLLTRMLEMNPAKRISAADACYHPFFYDEMPVCRDSNMKEFKASFANQLQRIRDSHEYEQRVKRRMEANKRFV